MASGFTGLRELRLSGICPHPLLLPGLPSVECLYINVFKQSYPSEQLLQPGPSLRELHLLGPFSVDLSAVSYSKLRQITIGMECTLHAAPKIETTADEQRTLERLAVLVWKSMVHADRVSKWIGTWHRIGEVALLIQCTTPAETPDMRKWCHNLVVGPGPASTLSPGTRSVGVSGIAAT